MSQLETDLEYLFAKRVRMAGGMSFKLVAAGRAGLPDRLVVLPVGRIYLVELKTDSGERSDIQVLLHERLAALGVHVHLVAGRAGVVRWVNERVNEDQPLRGRTR